MAINFKKIELCDKDTVTEYILKSERRFCENTFGNMFCWQPLMHYQFAVYNNTLIVGNPDNKKFDLPTGEDVAGAIAALKEQYGQFTLRSLSKDDLQYVEGYEVVENTGFFDYIYDSEKLQTLTGKKLAAKRNHINAFLADGEWYTEKITPDKCDMLIEFNQKWCEGKCHDEMIHAEVCAAKTALKNFEALGLMGLMLYKNGTLVAYSYGEPINHDTFCVHVEKADNEVRGAYQMINREFVRTFCKDYKYVNREDDAGDEGLRRAKLSYYPTEVGKKYKAVIK